ncbi:efflux RND transporter periplasmic adaptor subunit [Pandoraea oxalativorans]|uniref:Efflux transporter periplasmic adaptor subunit n=1 Tax=Pandoraea oxalativorans TaxID=573737 RepID=A0A0E3YE59_9BURK|nr:efflux RND transporter periplasmic adaptor subunit [Pandoraea oxalativorans]AKC70707.1 efflux transporter periplasmic adaptor subunit [Pandoraea oxalativorans]
MTEKHHAELAIPEHDPADGRQLPPRHGEFRRAKIVLIVVALLLVAGAARTTLSNFLQRRAVANVTSQNAKQFVSVVTPQATAASETLLPATLRGAVESPIYARATGYLLHRYVDIGAKVKQGQLLADLDTPETDQELAQAIAQRNQINASLGLARSSLDRWQQLRQRDAVSQQELDERQSTYTQGVANLAAADANVKRLEQLESFKRIVAPFDGVITQRNVDVGDLIAAGSGSAQAMFSLAQTDPLRVYAQVPQAYAQSVSVGQPVVVTQAELPGQHFQGKITHVSGAIDVATRSLQIEAALPNPDGKLRPGAYVQLALPGAVQPHLSVPANALLFRAEGPRVAVVDDQGIVHLHKIVIAQDLGQTLELADGVSRKDRVIVNPSDSVDDGDQVQAKALETKGVSKPAAKAQGGES